MATRTKMLHEVTAAIYKNGNDKACSRWSFFFRMDLNDPPTLSDTITRLKGTSGLHERAEELGVRSYKVRLSIKRNEPEPDFPKGRIFSMDTQDQFQDVIPLLENNYELIGNLFETVISIQIIQCGCGQCRWGRKVAILNSC